MVLSIPDSHFFEGGLLTWGTVGALGVLYLTYLAGLVVYRLTLHPLARFPGPFLCRVSFLPQAYYEAVLQGRFIYEIPKYHAKYGKFRRC